MNEKTESPEEQIKKDLDACYIQFEKEIMKMTVLCFIEDFGNIVIVSGKAGDKK